MNDDNINDFIPSLLNPRTVRKHDLSLTQNSVTSRYSLSLRRSKESVIAKQHNNKLAKKITPNNKENLNTENLIQRTENNFKTPQKTQDVRYDNSIGYSAIEDLTHVNDDFNPLSICDFYINKPQNDINKPVCKTGTLSDNERDKSYIVYSTVDPIEFNDSEKQSVSTYIYNVKPSLKVSFGVTNCESIDVDAKNISIKKFSVSHNGKNTNVDCEMVENSQKSSITETDENMNETYINPLKRQAVAVSLEIKKQKQTHDDNTENSKILILNTNAIEKISHIIVQPPNYKLETRKTLHISKNNNEKFGINNGNFNSHGLKQISLDRFHKDTDEVLDVSKQIECPTNDDTKEMSKNLGVTDAVKCDRLKISRASKRDLCELPKSAVLHAKRDLGSPKRQDVKTSASEAPTPRVRNESLSAHSPRNNVESLHFGLPLKAKSNKTSVTTRNIPHHKIVAGTHFAVDAFSYGDIPNVKHYFLTHFHSDHYSGLKKTFNKLLYCSKITADLCVSRLGVNLKNIQIVNVDEMIKIEGTEIVAVDANHCPGAVMFVFTLLNGKTLLHTGDFRACPYMESYPVFWNKDIHTIYLDTTYCNPRYDFPTQEQSLEMALCILKQKKMVLDKIGKKFSSVLIVCGTYTIGKEKFFLGLARRVGCAVWACPEKERVLQIVEGRPCSREPPQSCQLHVVPMRDLTHEKLQSYLESLQGAFSEVVAFKPSGWENGKNSKVEKDLVTIHGIPYSEHSSFSELIRFVKFVKPKQVVPTVDISGGVKAVQKYFPCPLVYKDEIQCQSKLTDYFSIRTRDQADAVT